MSIAVLILGESGTGKSTSMRNMDPASTLLIQIIPKPLPFRNKEWRPLSKDGGNIIVTADYAAICAAMDKTTRPVVVVDDFQYLLATEFMARSHETGFQKFTDLAKHYFDVLTKASALAHHKRVYMLSHTDTNDQGKVKAKTIGKLLDEKITVEGLVTIVLRTLVVNGQYVFSTKNSGNDTTKCPMNMFESEHIENDLAAVDKRIIEYYELADKAS